MYNPREDINLSLYLIYGRYGNFVSPDNDLFITRGKNLTKWVSQRGELISAKIEISATRSFNFVRHSFYSESAKTRRKNIIIHVFFPLFAKIRLRIRLFSTTPRLVIQFVASVSAQDVLINALHPKKYGTLKRNSKPGLKSLFKTFSGSGKWNCSTRI